MWQHAYGSEGPKVTAKEREAIKKQNEHGLGLESINKNCMNTALPYLASTKSDVVLIQEPKMKWKEFSDCRNRMANGTYLHRGNEGTDQKWKMEGSPSIDGPNNGAAAGNW